MASCTKWIFDKYCALSGVNKNQILNMLASTFYTKSLGKTTGELNYFALLSFSFLICSVSSCWSKWLCLRKDHKLNSLSDLSSAQAHGTTVPFSQGHSLFLQNENWWTWPLCFLFQIKGEISKLHLEEMH